MPRQYKKPIVKRFSPIVEEEVILHPIVVEEVILPPIVVEDGYETPDEIGITMPKNITWAPKRKYTRNDDIGAGNNFYINKFPKI
jgi:hypothetical protein